ncbi:MAG: hypothetical protein ABL949_10845 [Fimbriimonadaceae bacterium]
MLKRAGRASIVTIIATVCVLACVGVVMFSNSDQGPETTVNRFMSALAEVDAKKLAKLSFIDGADEGDIEKKWTECLDNTKYFQFRWAFDGTESPSAETVTARIKMQQAGESEANLNRIPLVKVKDEWKVDVGAINRSFYPSLPR